MYPLNGSKQSVKGEVKPEPGGKLGCVDFNCGPCSLESVEGVSQARGP